MLGDRIKELRIRAKISQKELAEKMNVTQGAVSQWETNRTMPDMESLPILAEILSVPVSDILNDNHQSAPKPNVNAIAETIYRRPGLRALFNTAKNASEEDINLVLDMLEVARRRSGK